MQLFTINSTSKFFFTMHFQKLKQETHAELSHISFSKADVINVDV